MKTWFWMLATITRKLKCRQGNKCKEGRVGEEKSAPPSELWLTSNLEQVEKQGALNAFLNPFLWEIPPTSTPTSTSTLFVPVFIQVLCRCLEKGDKDWSMAWSDEDGLLHAGCYREVIWIEAWMRSQGKRIGQGGGRCRLLAYLSISCNSYCSPRSASICRKAVQFQVNLSVPLIKMEGCRPFMCWGMMISRADVLCMCYYNPLPFSTREHTCQRNLVPFRLMRCIFQIILMIVAIGTALPLS